MSILRFAAGACAAVLFALVDLACRGGEPAPSLDDFPRRV
jgi:hypothetical protein